MLIFAKVVEKGSFSEAARAFNQSPSAVSKRVAQLEETVGVRLLRRTKSGVLLTDEGRDFHQRCARIASQISEAEAEIAQMRGRPEGRLRIGATVAFAKAQILPILPTFLARCPEITVSLELTDREVDLAEAGYDVAIRFSEQIHDEDLIARKLAHNQRVICAAPAYLARRGRPERPADLAEHDCLRLSTVESWNIWRFANGETIEAKGNFEASSADAIYHAALAGLGIARLSTYLISADLRAGRLVRLIPSYADEGSEIFALYSGRRNLPPKVRAFVDFLAESFSPPPWEEAR